MHYFLEVSRYTSIAYIAVYLILTCTERLFSTACYFLSYVCWSVNCMSRVIKLHNCFLTCWETETRFILSFMETSNRTFSFFHVVCKLLKSILNHFLLVRILYELTLWFQRCPEALALIYIWDLLDCHLWKNWFVCTYSVWFLFVPIQTFFWSVNCTSLVCKLCMLFQTILDLWAV